MTTSNQFSAEPRTVLGKKVGALRRSGITPANVYGGGQPSTAIQLETKGLQRQLVALGKGSAAVVAIGGAPHKVIVKDWDVHPVSSEVIHVDFQRASS
jgi:large subunit ribosomal protein L25